MSRHYHNTFSAKINGDKTVEGHRWVRKRVGWICARESRRRNGGWIANWSMNREGQRGGYPIWLPETEGGRNGSWSAVGSGVWMLIVVWPWKSGWTTAGVAVAKGDEANGKARIPGSVLTSVVSTQGLLPLAISARKSDLSMALEFGWKFWWIFFSKRERG